MYKKLIFACAVFIVLIFAGCSDDDNNPVKDNTKHEIWPMAVGNAWGGTLVVSASGSTMEENYVYFIDRDTVVNNETWYAMNVKIGDMNLFMNWLTLRDDGVYQINQSGDSADYDPTLNYKYPAAAGYSYYVVDNNDTALVTIQSCATSVGTYKCYVYNILFNGVTMLYYMSPDVGPVKMEAYGGSFIEEWVVDSVVLK